MNVSATTPATDGNTAAYRVLLVYFFVEYVRPQDWVPVLGALKIGFIVTLLSAIMWWAKGDKRVLKDPLIRTHILFILVGAATVTFAVNTYWVFQICLSLTLMFVAGVLPSTGFLATPERISHFVKVWVVFHVLLALTAFRTGGRGPGAFLGDENDLALALNMAIPYAFFMSQSPLNKGSTRWWYRAATGLLIAGSIFTWSRGGFLGLLAGMGMVWLLSKHKVRNLAIILILGFAVLAAISHFSEKGSVLDEFQTISDPNDSTRIDRINSWARAWEMFMDNPVLGVGVSNFGWRVADYEMRDPNFDFNRSRLHGGRAAHSLYFTLLPEMGSVGALLYLAMIWLIVRKLIGVIRMQPKNSPVAPALGELALLAKAMIASLVAFLVSGAFVTVVYYPHLFYLVGFCVALSLAAKTLVAAHSTSSPAGVVHGATQHA